MDYFLGVDIGTTSAKAIAFNERGEMICKHSVGYEMQHPLQHYSEIDATEILEAVITCVNKVLDTMQPGKPAFISFSAMMHSLIVVNHKGEPITNCIIWADNRAAGIAKQLRSSPEGESFYHATGVPVHAMSPFCKLLWFKDHEPGIFSKAHKFIGIKEFIFFKLFDSYFVDTAIASATGLLNLYSLQWDKSVLDLLELPVEKLSEVVPVEHVLYYTKKNNASYSLNVGGKTACVFGGSDGAMAHLGAGSNGVDSISVTIGTSAAVRALSAEAVTEKNMSVFCYHAYDHQYVSGGASNNGAVVIQWLKESLLQTTESYEELLQLAERVNLSNDNLFFVPYILGERAPVWNSDAKGIFCGLSISHTKAHLVRAAIEGITFNVYTIAKLVMNPLTVDRIYATGGFAESALWLQLLADIFNCRVLVSGTLESSALGAVMVGIKALNLPVTIQPSIVSEHQPDPVNHITYQRQYHKFERLYKIFKNEFAEVGEPAKPIPVY